VLYSKKNTKEATSMNIEVTNEKAEIAIAIKETAVNMGNMAEAMGKGYGKLMDYLSKLGKQPSGPPYCAYINGNEDYSQFDIEMGMPVDEAVPVQGEFYMSKTHEGKAVCTIYKGPFKEIEVAYTALMEYLPANSLESTGVYYDYYLNDPDVTPESELLTRVVFPVK